MLLRLLGLALTCLAHARGDTQCEQEVRDVLDSFNEAGVQLAEYACLETVGAAATRAAIQSLRGAANLATASTCNFGDGSTDGPSVLALEAESGYLQAETCSCTSGASILRVATQSALRNGGSAGTDWTAILADIRRHSESHCAPGTENGVLDQSAEECAILSSGNASAASRDAGLSLFRPGPSCKAAPLRAARMLADSTALAIAAAEEACSFTLTFTCALTSSHVRDIALAQVAGFAEGAESSGCDCSTGVTEAAEALGKALPPLVVSAHDAVCQASQAAFTDMAVPLASSFSAPMSDAAPSSCDGVASPVPRQAHARRAGAANVYPYNKCGGNDYARTLADKNAKHVAPAIASACCVNGYECMVKSRWYAACRPAGEAAPQGWNGTIVTHQDCMAGKLSRGA